MNKKAICLAFSARKEGNSLKILKYIKKILSKQAWDVQLINFYDYNITPCSHCNYECFTGKNKKNCPINDDLKSIYKKALNTNLFIYAIPVYGGSPASLYSIWKERAQGIIKTEKDYNKLSNIQKGYIVIGNVEAGGGSAFAHILADDVNRGSSYKAMLLQAHEYGQNSIKGNLIDLKDVQKRITRFVTRLIKDCK